MSKKPIPNSVKIEIIKFCLASEEGREILAKVLKNRIGVTLTEYMNDPLEILVLLDSEEKIKEIPEETDRFELMDFE